MEDNDKFDARQKFPQHVTRYIGKLEKEVFVWQCAYADCKDTHFVLRGPVWDRLREYTRLVRAYNRKEYDSADVALLDMMRAIHECDECEKRWAESYSLSPQIDKADVYHCGTGWSGHPYPV